MIEVNNKNELSVAIKDKETIITIVNNKIVKSMLPLNNLTLDKKDINRCKYTLEKSYDSTAFLGFIGFAPLICEICDVSFLEAMGIISSVGLHEILVILTYYKIDFENNKIILSHI